MAGRKVTPFGGAVAALIEAEFAKGNNPTAGEHLDTLKGLAKEHKEKKTDDQLVQTFNAKKQAITNAGKKEVGSSNGSAVTKARRGRPPKSNRAVTPKSSSGNLAATIAAAATLIKLAGGIEPAVDVIRALGGIVDNG